MPTVVYDPVPPRVRELVQRVNDFCSPCLEVEIKRDDTTLPEGRWRLVATVRPAKQFADRTSMEFIQQIEFTHTRQVFGTPTFEHDMFKQLLRLLNDVRTTIRIEIAQLEVQVRSIDSILEKVL